MGLWRRKRHDRDGGGDPRCSMCGADVPLDDAGYCPLGHHVAPRSQPPVTTVGVAVEDPVAFTVPPLEHEIVALDENPEPPTAELGPDPVPAEDNGPSDVLDALEQLAARNPSVPDTPASEPEPAPDAAQPSRRFVFDPPAPRAEADSASSLEASVEMLLAGLGSGPELTPDESADLLAWDEPEAASALDVDTARLPRPPAPAPVDTAPEPIAAPDDEDDAVVARRRAAGLLGGGLMAVAALSVSVAILPPL